MIKAAISKWTKCAQEKITVKSLRRSLQDARKRSKQRDKWRIASIYFNKKAAFKSYYLLLASGQNVDKSKKCN